MSRNKRNMSLPAHSGLRLRCDQYRAGVIVQVKWQQTSGSADAKYPYEVECVKQDPLPCVIVLDGGGYKPGAKAWLEAQVDHVDNLLEVCDFGGFARWLSRSVADGQPTDLH